MGIFSGEGYISWNEKKGKPNQKFNQEEIIREGNNERGRKRKKKQKKQKEKAKGKRNKSEGRGKEKDDCNQTLFLNNEKEEVRVSDVWSCLWLESCDTLSLQWLAVASSLT